MVFPVNLFQSFSGDMGINLCGRNIRMAEHKLNGPKISAVFKKMCSETVPEHMGSQGFSDVGFRFRSSEKMGQSFCKHFEMNVQGQLAKYNYASINT